MLPPAYADAWKKALPQADAAGHAVAFEQPEAVGVRVERLIGR